MPVEKSAISGFTSTWEKTASWAQSQGISKKAYYPIYQMDSARLLQGETPMSTAERTRAILAAANPKDITPVPGDKPNPTNVWGNTVNDLRSIFTGLAPNHLVANVFDTVKSAVLHPSTFVKPLEELATGNIKQGLEDAAGLNGQPSILSWLPGVYVAGELAQGGLDEVLAHPVVSLLDVAPFGSAGKILTAGADASRVASLADKVGMTPDAFRDASLPAMTKSFVLTRKLGDLPGTLANRASSLVDATGKDLTVGDALNRWITSHVGMGKTLSSLMKGMLNINDQGTDHELALMRPAEMAMQVLKPDEQKEVDVLWKEAQTPKGRTPSQIMNDSSIPEPIRTAFGAQESVRSWVSDEALASGAAVAFHRGDGTVGVVESAGTDGVVTKAKNDLQDSQDELVKAMTPNNKITNELRAWDGQVYDKGGLLDKFNRAWTLARGQADKIDGTQRYEKIKIDQGARKIGKDQPKFVTLDIRKQAQELFGSKSGDGRTGDDGIMGQIHDAASTKDFAGLKALTGVAMRRLGGNGVKSIDASLDPTFAAIKKQVEDLHDYATRRIEKDAKFRESLGDYSRKAGGPGYDSIRPALKKYLAAKTAFDRAVWDHPTADWIDVVRETFIKNLVKEEATYHGMANLSKVLKDQGWDKEKIAELRRDPVKMGQLIVQSVRAASGQVMGTPIMDEADISALWKSGVDEANKLRQQGHEVAYIPQVSDLKLRGPEGNYGVHIDSQGKVKRSSRSFGKKETTTARRYDVTASLHNAAKEALQIDGTIEYATHILGPHLIDGQTAWGTITREFGDQIRGYQTGTENIENVTARIMRDNFKMVKFDPQSTFGFTPPSWGSTDQYIPESIAKALPKMLDKGQFPLEGAYSKITNTFRFSILGLSPRYTAHVAFGGTFLLALRSSSGVLKALPEAYRIIKGTGDVPKNAFDGAAQRGVDPVVYRTFANDVRNQGSQVFHRAGGSQAAKWLAEEHIEKFQKVKLAAAAPVHWLKAVGDLNYKFTNSIGSFQRAAAYVDEFNRVSKRGFKDPVTGEITHLTKERAGELAMEHSLKVMGDLKAMTPLERNTFTQLMPFYGWTKHILQYVSTYPADHPFRAQFLSVLAEQNTDDVASGLPKRLQFLLFLGSPDAEGNVSALDVRSFDPLRDVANYATLAGFIGALNPVITAPLSMIDPSIIFGGVPLYPKVGYDAFYGIEDAGSQGSPLTALEQVVPQVSALDTALNLSGQFRQLAATNPNQFAKDIFGALNIPFLQVQHLNLKQIAGKDEIDRYHVASTAATNAFQSGDFSQIANLASVPDPENADYNISPTDLSGLYNQLLQEFPGQAPSDTATPPPPYTL